MEDKSLIKISNALNLTRQEFNVLEKHIFLTTLLNLKERQGFNLKIDDDMVNVQITFSASELKETNRNRIKNALDKITSRKIYFERTNKNKDYFGYVVPFSYANYSAEKGKESTVTIVLNAKCKKLFLELANGYTTTDLKAILNLRSVYSIRMYELVSQYLNQGKWVVDVDDLKKLLDIDLNKFPSFTDFEKRILFYSQKELWSHCGLFFEWKIFKKERQRITTLEFSFKTKDKQERVFLNEDVQQTINYLSTLSPADIAQMFNSAMQKYTLTDNQMNYIFSDKNVLNEFIRIDMIIESMITKGKPPKDRTKYLATSLKLDKIKLKKKQ